MRALRRALISFWYATIEDVEAARIEAVQACLVVNILDEAVFDHALGEPYRQRRAKDRLGRAVTGLELVRNCETHAHVGFDGLIVERRVVGVPLHGGTIFRVVPAWAECADLPSAYVERGTTPNQKRARGEAQHGYRTAIAGRPVLETLLDAIAFFQQVDPRAGGQLRPRPPARVRGAATRSRPRHQRGGGAPLLHQARRPGHLRGVPAVTGHSAHRTTLAQWQAADDYFAAKVKEVRKVAPAAEHHEIRHVLRVDGEVLGYAGVSPHGPATSWFWVEPAQQVWRDVRNGYRYFVLEDEQVDVVENGHQRVAALLADGTDVLARLSRTATSHTPTTKG